MNKICKKCGAEMNLRINARSGKSSYCCLPCHAKYMREVYPVEKKRDSISKYRKNNAEKVKVAARASQSAYSKRLRSKHGVSMSTLKSRNSSVHAYNSRQIWTNYGDDMVLNMEYSDKIIAKKLGRSIRSVSRRRNVLRKKAKDNVGCDV